MLSPYPVAKWGGLLLLGGLFGVVLWKLADGSMALDELFEGEIRDPNNPGGFTTYASAGRIQTFVVTISVAFYYLMQVVHDPTKLPTLPKEMLAALAGSQALYLGGKAQAMLLGRVRDFIK